METNYLIHHGVKGQKWGVRRYQNPDGTLTSAGIKQQSRDRKKIEKLARSTARSATKYRRTGKEKYFSKAKAYQSKGEIIMKKYEERYGETVYGNSVYLEQGRTAVVFLKYGKTGKAKGYY